MTSVTILEKYKKSLFNEHEVCLDLRHEQTMCFSL